MRAKPYRTFLGSVLAATLALPSFAQSTIPAASDNVTLLGPVQPEIRKATALVNGDVLTDTDVDQRLNLVVAANGGQISPEERERLRVQILRNLIDEKLQVQEAKNKDITIPDSEVDETFARVARNFKMNPDQFNAYLAQRGASSNTLKTQIRAELAWNRLLRRRVEPFVTVGDDEVNAVIKRLEESKGKDEYRVGEIFLAASDENLNQRMAVAENIVQQVRRGASFVAYARQFSESASAGVGGDLGWVRPEQLAEQVRPVLTVLPAGQISNPIRVPGGITIIAVVDKRQALTADPLNATLSLKQITLKLPAGSPPEQVKSAAERLTVATRSMGGCGRAETTAAALGGEVAANDQIRIRDLPAPLQSIMQNMRIGEVTPPFGSPDDGLRVIVLCGRDDSSVAPKMPSFDELADQMQQQRVTMAAQRYLRDLRRDAIVDYR
ncbi:MAG: peptidylprolyl isomerase [Sphingomonadaceae bacterium]|nr:peptidylprolyl isomerase [Sphingomonadaceae bacterium]